MIGRPISRHWPAIALAALVPLGSAAPADTSRVATGRGTFLVEVNDPAVKVRAEGDDLVVSRLGGDEVRLKVPAEFDRLAPKEAVLAVERDGRAIVTVRRVARGPASPTVAGPGRTILNDGLLSASWSLAITADGKTLVSSHYGAIRVWDLPARRERLGIPVGGRMVRRVSITPDGSTIASAEYVQGAKTVGNVVVRDGVTGAVRREMKAVPTGVNCVAIAPDGKVVVSSNWGRGEVYVWDAEKGEEAGELRGHSAAVPSVVYNPDGKTLASAGDTTVRLWDVDSGATRRTLRGHSKHVEAVAFSADGKLVASGGFDDTARVWDAETGKLLATLEHDRPVLSVAFSPDGKTLATGSGRWGNGNYGAAPAEVTLWEIAGGKPLVTLPPQPNQVFALLFTPDGKTLITASLSGAVTLWDLAAFPAR